MSQHTHAGDHATTIWREEDVTPETIPAGAAVLGRVGQAACATSSHSVACAPLTTSALYSRLLGNIGGL
jgi:hypothetical protein